VAVKQHLDVVVLQHGGEGQSVECDPQSAARDVAPEAVPRGRGAKPQLGGRNILHMQGPRRGEQRTAHHGEDAIVRGWGYTCDCVEDVIRPAVQRSLYVLCE
jgi:hypothetical protein